MTLPQSWGMMKMLLGAADKFTDIVIGQEGGVRRLRGGHASGQ